MNKDFGVTCFSCDHDEYGPTPDKPGKIKTKTIELLSSFESEVPICPECGVSAEWFDYRDGV